jgi:RND superfamily putative drug exporter
VAALARWCFRHRWTVLIAWLVVFVAVAAGARVAGSEYRDNFTLPGTDTQAALDLLQHEFPAASGDQATIVLHARSGTLQDAAPRAAVTAMLAQVSKLPHVAKIESPYDAKGAAQLSSDGRTGFATVTVDGQATSLSSGDITRIVDTARAADRADGGALQVETTGNLAAVAEKPKQSYSELIGVVAAAVILFLAFGSVLAMTLPLITALVALGISTNAIPLLSHVATLASVSSQLATLIGLGVGIDYALFIVNRHRIALRAGRSPEQAAVNAANTSGRAVLFAGSTVCIAILGLIALGVSFFNGMAVATALAVGFTMAASLTLLPALLSLFGLKVLPRKHRAAVRAGEFIDGEPVGIWARWSQFVARKRIPVAVISGAVMIIIALPFFSLQLGASDQGSDPKGSTTRSGYDLIAGDFGVGYNSTLEAVVSGPGAADTAYLQRVSKTLAGIPGVDPGSLGTSQLTQGIAFVTFKTTTSPQSEKTYTLVRHLRSSVLPPLYDGTGNRIYAYGGTAINVDFATVLGRKMPLFITVVVGLSFILLLLAFRSLVIPLTAAVMNLLAAGGSFGVAVAIFQYGWLSDSMGAGPGGPIDAWMPVMLFAILFGLSMDYQVFLVSRMHEEWVHTRDNRRSVTTGQAETGGIITAAALIMIAVFMGFLVSPGRPIKIFGTGLASAVFLDAFILRTMLVPALMNIFGTANWYLPKWLDRILPHFSVEPADEAVIPAQGSGSSDDDRPEDERELTRTAH